MRSGVERLYFCGAELPCIGVDGGSTDQMRDAIFQRAWDFNRACGLLVRRLRRSTYRLTHFQPEIIGLIRFSRFHIQ